MRLGPVAARGSSCGEGSWGQLRNAGLEVNLPYDGPLTLENLIETTQWMN